jgi:antitoxin component YwqK of YwqJK toxin-antitoxin module
MALWNQDKKDGFGILYFKNGIISYNGTWEGDEYEGYGIDYYEN